MLCPACKVELNMSERQGIEIDYCPKCRGVWLDRGELDKIIERSLQEQPAPAQTRPQPAAAPRYDRGGDDRYHREPRREEYGKYRDDDYHRRRKKSFLSELLDF